MSLRLHYRPALVRLYRALRAGVARPKDLCKCLDVKPTRVNHLLQQGMGLGIIQKNPDHTYIALPLPPGEVLPEEDPVLHRRWSKNHPSTVRVLDDYKDRVTAQTEDPVHPAVVELAKEPDDIVWDYDETEGPSSGWSTTSLIIKKLRTGLLVLRRGCKRNAGR